MANTPYSWPLAVSTHTFLDKARIAWWLLTSDRFTMGEKTLAFEAEMSAFSGMHAVAVSSGSTANQLVFEMWKVKHPGEIPVVIVPAVTWISSLSPAMMAGMEVVPCDVNLTDLAFAYDHLRNLLDRHKARKVIIWPTSLIGYTPDMGLLHKLAADHGNAEVWLDSCENTFSRVSALSAPLRAGCDVGDEMSILASAAVTTTSCYFAHQIVAVEMGFAFFRDQADADLARMFRNHGMTRSLPSSHELRRSIEAAHPDVDPQFLFGVAGTNLRPSDVHAMFGLADMKRIEESTKHRVAMYRLYRQTLDLERYYLPPPQDSHVPFCIPVFVRDAERLAEVKSALGRAGVECRPVVGGFLGKQPCLKHLFEMPALYPNAQWVHDHGLYIGVHSKVTRGMILDLTDLLNTL